MVKDLNGKQEYPLGENKIGYVRLTQFGDKTSGDLDAALKKLKAQGMRAFILDLRWNPGGLLDQAVDVCQKFLPRGQPVVTTEGRNPSQNRAHRARGRGDQLSGLPMVVLVNQGSASASEIVAGCLQDVKRAVILGEKTFGKGSVQSIMPLPEGAALRLTTAKYYTPSHKVIHEQGVTPDVVVMLSSDEERDIQLQRAPGGVDSLVPEDRERVRNVQDPQFDRAMDLLQGILLYAQRVPAPDERVDPSGKMAAKGAELLTR
jgi:carboxyl-terminal processing protease